MDIVFIIYIVVGIVSWLVMAAACAWLAGQKGRDPVVWGMLGLVLGLLALVLVAVAPAKSKRLEDGRRE